jgi:excinuclease ABC subunit A
VLDEPSVGLHPRDTARLVRILEHLRDTGNTVVVVEHEPGVIRAADQIVDLGPGSGEKGGQVVFQGPFKDLLRSDRSLTGQYLSSRKQIDVPPRRPVALAKTNDDWRMAEATVPYRVEDSAFVIRHSALRLSNAACHNLKNLSAEIPLNRFVCLTGVSGSGKTTLVREVLLPALQERLKGSVSPVKASDRLDSEPATEDTESDQPSPVTCHAPLLEGWESLNQVVLVDQSPLGKTPRSNPVVYIGAFDEIRELFAQADLARQRGLNASAFSFNSALGQCQRCRGAGFEKVEMQFLSDVFIRCPDCNGRRYRDHVLEVKLKGAAPDRARRHTPRDWSIADLLEATVDDALEFLLNFIHLPAGRRALGRLKLLQDVGLGYLRLGQPIQTLSGGESQRLKLVSHLAESAANEGRQEKEKREKGERETTPFPTDDTTNRPTEPKRTLFLFDEPTTGLHFDDVRVLLQVFQRLVNAGHSLLVIEHNLDVIKCADWVIDLGPEAGERGGQLVVAGTPEDIAACDASHTGRFLREVLSLRAASPSTPARGGATDQGR